MNRLEQVYSLVSELYSQTTRPEAQYLWRSHIPLVAQYAADLADRFDGNKDLAVAGALLHDIADIWLERDDPEFDKKTNEIVDEVLTKAGFSEGEITTVKKDIIEPHSCYPGHKPTVHEGKIMATADALAHFNSTVYTDARTVFSNKAKLPIKDYQDWALKKLDRDFNDKIFFVEVKEENKHRYLDIKENLVTIK